MALKTNEIILPSKTRSLCPECKSIIEANIYEENGRVMIDKECKVHGYFKDVYWGDVGLFKKASRFQAKGKKLLNPNIEKENPVCPTDCGLCRTHLNHSALTNIVLTNRCDLSCWYCFFYAKKAGYIYEPTIEQIRQMVRLIKSEKPVPGNAVQLTGGEPTLREDLIDIIKMIKEEGIDHIQLNTNGIRISQDLEFTKKVREAGVNTLYLSFDGTTSETNKKNHWEIPGVLENCRKANLGIVLVPTILNTVNDHEAGNIIRFGFENIDIIRSVNFQPVSLVGRMTKKEREKFRITIPDLIKRIEDQMDGEIGREDFYPVPCVSPITQFVEAVTGRPQYELSIHFACGMATYVFKEGDRLIPITRFVDVEGLFEFLREASEEIKKGRSRFIVGAKLLLNLRKFIDKDKQPGEFNFAKIIYDVLIKHDYHSLGQFHLKSLFIGMMHFQDLYNYDINRVMRCDIHYATPDGRIIPFCAFNVIPEWYRDKIQTEYGIPIEEWEKQTGRSLKDDFYIRKKVTARM
jgi:hypothetical protein